MRANFEVVPVSNRRHPRSLRLHRECGSEDDEREGTATRRTTTDSSSAEVDAHRQHGQRHRSQSRGHHPQRSRERLAGRRCQHRVATINAPGLQCAESPRTLDAEGVNDQSS